MTDRDLRALAELARAAPPAAPPLSAALEAELGGLAAVTPRRPLRQLTILLASSLVYGAGVLAVVAVRRDLHELPPSWLVGAAAAWLLGFGVPAYLATVPGPGAVTPRWRLAGVAAAIVTIGVVVLGLALRHPTGAHSQQYGWARFIAGHTCLEIGLVTALVPVIAGASVLRGALPVGARWIAAALGAAGGCLGGLVLHLHCNVTDGLHVGLVHGGVVVSAALLSAALVPRATRA